MSAKRTPDNDDEWKVDPRWVFTIISIVLLIAHFWHPNLLDDKALIILAVAALPWLGSFLKSFKAFGLEAELRDIRRTAEEARNTSLDTAQRLDLETGKAAAQIDNEVDQDSTKALVQDIHRLADNYVAVRRNMTSGGDRTAEMTRLFHLMMDKAHLIGPGNAEVLDGIKEKNNAGRVLAAIAYAYELPGEATVGRLLDAIHNSSQPFVQYWGLMALRKLVKKDGVSSWTAGEISMFRMLKFKKSTDRAWVHRQIEAIIERST